MIPIKSKEEIAIMKEGGAVLARIMKDLLSQIKIGVSTNELNRVASALVFDYKAEPAFLGHEGYPAVLCTSVNNVIVHGLPSDYQLKPGDVLSLDLGIKYKGFYTDMAVTKLVEFEQGQTLLKLVRGLTPYQLSEKKKLIKVAKVALELAIAKTKPGATLGDIGFIIQGYVEKQGFKVARNLCGHGIGRELHEEPQILNFGKPGQGEVLKEGMVICLEPMITMGSGKIKKSSDGFTYETDDGSLACHFEHTVAVNKKDCSVLTKI